MALINASNWSPTQAITATTKSSLLQQLVYEEVIEKRHKQILDLKKGLQMFRLVSLMRRYPHQLQSLLVYKMLGLFHFGEHDNEKQKATITWFKEYI